MTMKVDAPEMRRTKMAELEFRFPSEQPYAYFGVKGTPEELGQLDFELIAQLYVNTQFAVLKGTVSAKDAIVGTPKPPTHPEAVTAVSEGLGATVVAEEDTPPEKPKAPWEKPKPKPVINADDFDF
jgi:hypothetical protein